MIDRRAYIDGGGLLIERDCIWYKSVRYEPERVCRSTIPYETGAFECDGCGENVSFDDPALVNYCPICGAKVVKQ